MKKSLLKDIGTYKNILISSFLNSSDIMELMLGSDYSQDDVNNILYNQIFPYLYSDETKTDIKTYLCTEIDIPKIPTATIKDMKIIIWIYCHRDYMQYSKQEYFGTRVDILADMVEREIRDCTQLGIGNLHLDSVTYMSENKTYYGRQMIFTVPDFKFKG